MNVQMLIDAVVRQTTVLIAQLATTGGVRAPIAHIANQIFLDLSRELDAQGVSRKVSADMFGMALRGYLRKIQHLSESSTDRGRSLWEAVYDYLKSQKFVTRGTVFRRFERDDEAVVRGVVHDLIENGLVFQTGTGTEAVLRAATDDELGQMRSLHDGRVDEFVWTLIYHRGPITRDDLAELEPSKSADLDGAISRLLAAGRIAREDPPNAERLYTETLYIPLGSELGWEAAVLDHHHAAVTTMCQKLRARRSSPSDEVGGSTYTYEVWPGHPLEQEARRQLSRFRQAHTDLRKRIRAHNDSIGNAPANAYLIVAYAGQHLIQDEEGEER